MVEDKSVTNHKSEEIENKKKKKIITTYILIKANRLRCNVRYLIYWFRTSFNFFFSSLLSLNWIFRGLCTTLYCYKRFGSRFNTMMFVRENENRIEMATANANREFCTWIFKEGQYNARILSIWWRTWCYRLNARCGSRTLPIDLIASLARSKPFFFFRSLFFIEIILQLRPILRHFFLFISSPASIYRNDAKIVSLASQTFVLAFFSHGETFRSLQIIGRINNTVMFFFFRWSIPFGK